MRKIAIVFLACLAAGSAVADSLAEHAARERAKKGKPNPRPVRVFTDDDLKKDKPPAEDGEASATPTPEPSYSDSYVPSPSVEDLAQSRKEWRERAKASADALAAARAAVAEAQGKLDLLKAPHNQLFPFGLGNPEVPAVEAELAALKERLAEAEKARVDFEREAGQSRIPSHWLQD
jgi:hypothetical protein